MQIRPSRRVDHAAVCSRDTRSTVAALLWIGIAALATRGVARLDSRTAITGETAMSDVVCVAEGASEVGADVTATALAPARIGAVPGEPHHANHALFANGTARLRRATTRDGFMSVERSLTENAVTGDNGRLNASTCCLVLAPKRAVKEWALQDLNPRQLGPKPSTLSRLS